MSLFPRRFSIALLALGALSCMRLDVFVFRPKPVDDPNADLMATSTVPAPLRRELKDEIVSADGTKVSAWLLTHKGDDGTPAPRHSRGILYCHGNHTHIGTTVPRVDVLWKLGYTVLVFDARGWGKTQGEQTEEGVYADARAARKFLEDELGSRARVALYGRSLGSAICTKLASEDSPRALVLESPISSVQTIIDDSVGLDTPGEWYADSVMDNPLNIAAYAGALLVMHGAEDDYVQPKYGEAIRDAAVKASPVDFWLVPGADHGTVPCVLGGSPGNDCAAGFSPAYLDRLSSFVDTALASD